MAFQYLNTPPSSGPSPSGIFTLSVPAPTDIWRKPPKLDVFNAPIIYKAVPTQDFRRARVTIKGDYKTLYDQGGIVIVLPPRQGGSGSTQKRWVKAGVEFYEGAPSFSVVAADLWADWSLLPLAESDMKRGEVTVEYEREREDDGTYGPVLRISLIRGEDGKRVIVREVTWAFHELDPEDELWIGVYAARPTRDDREALLVELSDFQLETI